MLRLMRFLPVLWLISASSLALGATEPDEEQFRAGVFARVIALTSADDYQGLNRLARTYRNASELTPNGEPTLAVFYQAFTRGPINFSEKDPDVWDARVAWAERWIQASPKSPSAHLLLARTLYYRGLSYRGEGRAASVSSKDHLVYRQYSEQSIRYLLQHKNVASRDPYYYSTLLNVLYRIEGGSERYWATFDEGARRYPDYYGIFSIPVGYSLPGWGGSTQALEDYAQKAITYLKPSQRASLYARLYDDAATNFGYYALYENSVDRSLLQQGFDNIVKAHPTQRNIQRFAFYACMTRDMSQTSRLIKRVTEPLDLGTWMDPAVYETCLNNSESH